MIVDFAARTVERILVGREQGFVFTRKENIAIPPRGNEEHLQHVMSVNLR
jgi:hypothetical protein